jgi:hypothetical protein
MTSISNSILSKPVDMEDPVTVSLQNVVFASDRSKQKLYEFYVRVTALGGSNIMSGPFKLVLGCVSGSVSFTDNNNFVTNHAMSINENVTAVYNFKLPSASLDYCSIERIEIVDENGNDWKNSKLVPCSNCTTQFYNDSLNCTWFDLVSSKKPDYI